MFGVGCRNYFEKTNDDGQEGENEPSGKWVKFANEDGIVKPVQDNGDEEILNSSSHDVYCTGECKVKGSSCRKRENRDIDVGYLDCQTGQHRDFNPLSMLKVLSSVQ